MHKTWHQDTLATNDKARTLFHLADFTSNFDEDLVSASELADCNSSECEMIHVVDVVHGPSMPEAQMGVQYSLESAARKLIHRRRGFAPTLLFGTPEDVILKRAADTRAKSIVVVLNRALSPEIQQGLVNRLMLKAACPVVLLPAIKFDGNRKYLRAQVCSRQAGNPSITDSAM